MSKTVDERVVEMRFDNKQFERGAGETMGTLEKLKNALNFKNASDGLDKLGRAAKDVNMNPLANGVEAVRKKFSALEVMAVGALLNISNKITDAGMHLAKELTIGQVEAGWDKYAKKTSAVQTIMAATAKEFTDTGEQMQFVNAQLEKLNWFTDETSYNFVNMVGNIGKFTSNNIALDDSVTAMQGVATWAAISGANAEEASRAMYNLAQAVAVGSVKLIDWKSIENANMATAGFKETALETAVAMGTLKKSADGTYRTIDKGTEVTISKFNSALSEGWFTSEVLLGTLDKYGSFTNKLYEVSEATDLTATEMLQWMDAYREAGTDSTKVINDMAKKTGVSVSELTEYLTELTDETYELGEKAFRAAQEAKTFEEAIEATKDAVSTGWMKTWEIIFGDYETAKVRWTGLANELYDVFAAGAEARNELLTEALGAPKRVIEKGGWDLLAKKVENAGVPVDDFIAKLIGLGSAAGAINGGTIDGINDFVASLEDGWLTIDMVVEAIDSFIAPINEVGDAVSATTKTFDDFKNVVSQVIRGDFGNEDTERFERLAEAGWNAKVVQDAVNKTYDRANDTFDLGRLTVEDFTDAVLELSEAELIQAGYTEEDVKALKALRDHYVRVGETAVDLRSGSELLFEGISRGWNGIKGILSAMRQGWEVAFPPMTADRIYNILKAFNSLAARFDDWVGNFEEYENNPLSQTVMNIRNTFAGLGSIAGVALDAVKAFVGFLSDTFGGRIGNGIDRVLGFTGSIGDFLVDLRQWLQANDVFRKGLDQLYIAILSGINVVKDWFASFKELPWVQEWLGKLSNVFNRFTGFISSNFPTATEAVKSLLAAFQNMWQNRDFSGITSAVKSLASALKTDLVAAWNKLKESEFFSSFADAWNKLKESEFFSSFTEGIQQLWNSIKTLDSSSLTGWARTLYDAVVKFIQPIIDFFRNRKSRISNAIVGFGNRMYESILNFVQPVVDFFRNGKEKISNAITGFGDGIQSASEALEPITNFLKNSLGKIISLLTLYAGIKLITNFIKTVFSFGEKVDAAIKLIGNPLKGFGKLVTSLFTTLQDTLRSFQGVAKAAKNALNVVTLLGVVAAIGGLALIIAQIGKVPTPQLIRGGIVVGAIAVVVMAILGLLIRLNNVKAKIDPASVKKKSNGMLRVLELSMAVFMLCVAFSKIYNVLKDGHPLAAIIAVGGVIAAIAVALGSLRIMDKLKLGSGGIRKSISSFLSLIAISASLKLIVSSFADLYNLLVDKDWRQLKEPLIAFGTVIAALLGIMALLSKTKGSAWSGIGILGAVLSLKVLISVLNDIGKFDLKAAKKNFGSYIFVFGAVFILMRSLSKMSGTAGSAGAGLLAVSAAIGIMGVVVRMIGGMKLESIAKGTAAVGAMLIFMGVFAKLANDAKVPLSTAATFIAVSVAVGILAAIVAVLSLLDPTKVVVATACLDSMILMMAAIVAVAKGASDIKVGPLITLLVAVGTLSAALVLIMSIADDQESIITATLALDSLMVCFSLMAAASKLAQKSALSIFVMSVAVAGLAGILYLLAENTNAEAALQCAQSLSLVLAAMSVALLAAGLAAPVVEFALLGIAGMIAVVGILGTLCGLVGALIKDHPSIMEDMDRGIALANKIGEFVGAFLGGVIDKVVTATLGSIGSGLSDFATNASIFFDKMSEIGADSSVSDGVKNLTSALLELTASSLIDSIASFFGGGIEDFSTKLDAFADAMVSYSGKIVNIDANAVTASAEAGQALAALVNALPKTGGIWQSIAGASDLNELSGKIVAYADAIVSYNDKVAGKTFDTMAINDSATAASELVNLLTSMPEVGGWKQTILGEKEGLDEFGETLVTFATGLNGFCDELGDNPNFKPIDSAVEAAGKLVELQTALPDEDGWLTDFFGGGKTDLSEFGDQLSTFGTALGDFSTSVSAGFADITAVNNSIAIAESLGELASNVNADASGNLDDFGKAVKTLGEGLGKYYGDIADVDIAILSSVITQVNRLVAMGTTLSGLDTSGMTGFGDALKTMAANGITEFCSAFENCTTQVQAAIVVLATAASDAVSGSDVASKFLTAGKDSAMEYINGLRAYSSLATTSGAILRNSAITGLSGGYSGAYTQGSNVGSGFIAGINGWSTGAYNAAYKLGRSAISGLQKAIDAHSPSREAGKMGDYTGIGFVNSVLDYVTKAYDAGGNVGSAAMDGIKKAVAKVATIFDDDIFTNPVIRPVVDLTDAQKSANSINEMFNRSIAMTAAVAETAGVSVESTRIPVVNTGMAEETGEGIQNEQVINQYNTFNITSDDPEEVANRVSYILQRQVERKESVWV